MIQINEALISFFSSKLKAIICFHDYFFHLSVFLSNCVHLFPRLTVSPSACKYFLLLIYKSFTFSKHFQTEGKMLNLSRQIKINEGANANINFVT